MENSNNQIEKINCDFANNFYDKRHEFEIENSASFDWKDRLLKVVDFYLYLDLVRGKDPEDIENYNFSARVVIKDEKTGKTAEIILEEVEDEDDN